MHIQIIGQTFKFNTLNSLKVKSNTPKVKQMLTKQHQNHPGCDICSCFDFVHLGKFDLFFEDL